MQMVWLASTWFTLSIEAITDIWTTNLQVNGWKKCRKKRTSRFLMKVKCSKDWEEARQTMRQEKWQDDEDALCYMEVWGEGDGGTARAVKDTVGTLEDDATLYDLSHDTPHWPDVHCKQRSNTNTHKHRKHIQYKWYIL